MDTTSLRQRNYEDFIPSSEWIQGEGSDKLTVELPGFRKERLKLKLYNNGNLRTSGERRLDGNRWRRFHKEIRIPDNCNGSEIRAKFKSGILTITFPKLIIEAKPVPVPPTQAPEPEAMPRQSEPEPDSAKSENGKGLSEKVEAQVVKEEKGKWGIRRVMVEMKMKRREFLINVAVVAVVLGVSSYVAYNTFRKIAEAETETGELLDFDEY